PLRGRQGDRALGGRELPRCLRHPRVLRHPLQPRVAAPARAVRHAQDRVRRGAHRAGREGEAAPRRHPRFARLGLGAGVRDGDVEDAPGARPRGLRHRHGRDPHARGIPGARVLDRGAALAGPRGARSRAQPTERARAGPRRSLARPRGARMGGPHADGRGRPPHDGSRAQARRRRAATRVMADEVLVIEAGHTERHYWRDLWRYRELFYFLAWRDILVRYKQTAIGIAWAVLRPLLTMVVFTVVFGMLGKFPSHGVPYPILVYVAMLP